MNFRCFFRAILSKPNIVIALGTIILSAVFRNFAAIILGLGGILFLLSSIASLLSGKNSEVLEGSNLDELCKVRDKLTPLIKDINRVLTNLKRRAKDNSKYMIISRFMEEIVNFETIIPDIVASYRKSSEFLRGKDGKIKSEISMLQNKLRNASGDSAKETYQKTLEEKQRTLEELAGIKSNLDECESKLHFILSSLQRIEAIIEASELKEQMSDEETRDLNQNVEAFSESVKDISKMMELR
ncbi:hypothetical protein [Acetivibrio clariflavus]|uniref:5-bromo-4-chloroindolyl phosphate hydrolysis protein n=1 Tax=Acetivibrio clariflavus (strain DSM 19732 / NBRC 101661 / EBR45) TaxID=720554 RepID=G8LST4_ACECE|nr:hypothetical protein [Acetivibrio clariflavus]AEV70447.1 hypothetical protein Clocl_4011 [Acetivibrio clariflavus DSM 19732]